MAIWNRKQRGGMAVDGLELMHVRILEDLDMVIPPSSRHGEPFMAVVDVCMAYSRDCLSMPLDRAPLDRFHEHRPFAPISSATKIESGEVRWWH